MAEANYSRAPTRREWAWETVTCPRCSKAFEAKRRDSRKYCSRACQNDHSDSFAARRCFNCLTVFRYQTSKANNGAGKGLFCSRECDQQNRRLYGHEAAGKRNYWAIYAAQCDRAKDKERRRAPLPSSKAARACRYCASAFTPRKWQTRCDACTKSREERAKERKKEQRRAHASRHRKTPAGRALKKKYKTLRRARKAIKAENIDPIKVFDRDGWRCHLCGCKTPRRLRGTNEPKAPELDHIVSLADGGSHTWGNVACACRACNGAKGARSIGQLRLGLAA